MLAFKDLVRRENHKQTLGSTRSQQAASKVKTICGVD